MFLSYMNIMWTLLNTIKYIYQIKVCMWSMFHMVIVLYIYIYLCDYKSSMLLHCGKIGQLSHYSYVYLLQM
jgi:hypothetical protein